MLTMYILDGIKTKRGYGMSSNDTKRIPLPNKKYVTVDSKNFEKFSGHRWYQHSAGYVFRWRKKGEKDKPKAVYLHKEIKPVPKNLTLKFKDDNKLNCLEDNLIPCTKAQLGHQNSRKVSSSKYSGVFWDAGKKKWIVQITKGKPHYVGSFPKNKEKEAAIAADFFSRKFYGEMANLNFPDISITYEELRDMLRKCNGHTSKYRGVSYHPAVDKWRARIKKIDLGLYEEEDEAAKAYDKKAIELFGEDTFLNFPKE